MVDKINNYFFYKNMPDDYYLYSQVENCICEYKNLLLAYSGGVDSTVLLDILAKLLIKNSNFFLRAVYVNHGFSANSVEWALHCAQECKLRKIPFDTVYINYDKCLKQSSNIEATFRVLRYQELFNSLCVGEILLTAHHMDDQVETFLLALKRGSGPSGLSGIHENILLFDNNRILRPLLNCSKTQLESYAYRKKLNWIEDNTNMDIRFDRNFLRIKIIPLLKKRWPSFNIVVKRSAELCRNQENLLKELLSEYLKRLIDSDGALFYVPLLRYSFVKRNAILRYWLNNCSVKMPSYQLLKRIWQEVVLSKYDANPVLYLGKNICRRFRKKLYILPISMVLSINIVSLPWDLSNNTIVLPHKLGLLTFQNIPVSFNECLYKLLQSNIDVNVLLRIFWDNFKTSGKILTNFLVRSPTANEKVSIRFGSVNGLLYILNRNRGRKLKKIWQELCVPTWLRNRIPLLFYNDTLISAIGVFITKDGKIKVENRSSIINITEVSSMAWRITWIQDISYYYIFKNIIRYL